KHFHPPSLFPSLCPYDRGRDGNAKGPNMSSGARAIDSPQNARAKKWLALTESRGIRKHGEFILSGRKTVPEALEKHAGRFTAALARTESDLNRLSLPASIERFVLAKPVFEALDTNGTGFPLLV